MDRTDKEPTTFNDVVLQILLVIAMAVSFFFIHDAPKKLFAKLRLRNRADIQAKQHFVRGAQLLAQARVRASTSRSSAISLAKEAQAEAHRAIVINPNDAASHLLNALALDLRGLRSSALDALDLALSPAAARSLSDGERADALLKRAELRMAAAAGQRGRLDAAIADLEEAVRLSPEKARALSLLGYCYEGKKMKEEAKKAYLEALKLEPQLRAAQEGVQRLGS